jgi:ribulose-phosphate 3-epimerase
MSSVKWIEALPANRLICEYSMWSANLTQLSGELARIAPHADVLHIDVADGHFAPAFLFFPDLVAAIRKITQTPIHVHLMVADAILLEQISQFADAGSDLISIHVENAAIANAALDLMKSRNIAAGIVLKVETPVESITKYLPHFNFVTLLGTAIGVKGQGLNSQATARLERAKQLIANAKSPHRIVLAADGGIREQTVPLLRKSGAETVVLGSLAFNAPDLQERTSWLHSL